MHLHDARGTRATCLSPATAFAWSKALSSPSVTNVNGDPWYTQSCGTNLVTTKTGTSKGCLPPHPRVRSNVRRPNPTLRSFCASRQGPRRSAPDHEDHVASREPVLVSPAEYHAHSFLAADTHRCFGASFGPAINPSMKLRALCGRSP